MNRHVRTVLFIGLGIYTWLLAVLVGGAVLATLAGTSLYAVLQLAITVSLLYPVLPVYRAIDDAASMRDAVTMLAGSGSRLVLVVGLFLVALLPISVPVATTVLAFPRFYLPSLLYPAVLEVRPVFGSLTGGLLSFGVLHVQLVWSYLLVDGGTDIAAAVNRVIGRG